MNRASGSTGYAPPRSRAISNALRGIAKKRGGMELELLIPNVKNKPVTDGLGKKKIVSFQEIVVLYGSVIYCSIGKKFLHTPNIVYV